MFFEQRQSLLEAELELIKQSEEQQKKLVAQLRHKFHKHYLAQAYQMLEAAELKLMSIDLHHPALKHIAIQIIDLAPNLGSGVPKNGQNRFSL